MNRVVVIIVTLTMLVFVSCKHKTLEETKPEIEILEVNLPTNYLHDTIWLDYQGAMQGFVIPSVNQTSNAQFDFNFVVKNLGEEEKEFFYKVYYQNESYKFPNMDPSDPTEQHEFAHENFYGSWEDTNIEFKSCGLIKAGERLKIEDSFRIVGNPRNEEKYFYKGENDRWKRNPRVGDYSFMIVVVDRDTRDKIPEEVSNINKKEGEVFVSPFYYFMSKSLSNEQACQYYYNKKFITVKASPDLGNGVFVNKYKFLEKGDDFDAGYNCNCNESDEMYENASVAQFIHHIDESSQFDNVPIIKDIFNESFTKEEYNWVRAFYDTEERIRVLPQTPKVPCQTIESDSVEDKIILRNPKSTYGNWQKENVGMITRHGFTYGKFTVKANLTELLNRDNVWNGITNAIWLIYQGGRGSHETGWNLRRPCREKGYMKTYWGGRHDDRVERVAYSEIDFEILKTVPYCPSSKFPPVYDNYEAHTNKVRDWNTKLPEDVLKDDANIAVCCTNWDMACWEPKNFSAGCHEVSHNGKNYLAHRWEDCYRAVTTKYMAPDDDVFGSDYYYFQIDWQPDKIIWRIGPEIDQLYEVGYIDQTISMIPDNQMLLIITQEFHNTDWWPGSPYHTRNIPFPAEDYVGEIYEIIIE